MAANKDKQKKITTGQQFEEMVSFLEIHPELVTGKFVGLNPKLAAIELWEELTVKLNSIGPPIRDEEGWKKVWADLKNKVKKKLRNEYADKNKTGGGKKDVILSNFEERVVTLSGMRQCVIGLEGRDFGDVSEGEIVVEANLGTQGEEEDIIEPTGSNTIQRVRKRSVVKRRITTQQKILDELKSQGKAQAVRFNELKELLKEHNSINLKRLKIEERVLELKEAKNSASIL